MVKTTTRWRVSIVGWAALSLGIIAETTSNALRAYVLGAHLHDRTITYHGVSVSLAGAVLVLGAVAVALAQARAAWVALAPGLLLRQRIVAWVAVMLLMSISILAMASNLLEAQRAKGGSETGAASGYRRTEAAYKNAAAHLAKLGQPRPVSVVQAEIASTQIDMVVWRRSKQCSEIDREDTKTLCDPILKLYRERGAAAEKMELEPKVEQLRLALADMPPPAAEPSWIEAAVSNWWAWLMGLGLVLVATFGSTLYATVDVAPDDDPPPPGRPVTPAAPTLDPPSPTGGRRMSRDDALADLRMLCQAGHTPPSQDWLVERWQRPKGTVSRWLSAWNVTREAEGRRKMITSA